MLPYVAPGADPSWHLYVVRTPQRDALLEHLQQNGIGAGVHYPVPLHLQPAYADLGYAPGQLPVSEEVADTCLSLPLYPEMTDAQQDRVVATIQEFISDRRRWRPETGCALPSRQERTSREPPIDRSTISVVVPARNEEATIAAVVERSFAAFAALGRAGEVLVVNDGSTDRTAAILAELGTRYPTLRVFTHRRSRGMTAGLQTMFGASVGDIVILIPADMESDPLVDVPALVNYLDAQDLDVAAGWRQERKDSKVLASRVYNAVMTAIGGVQVHDGNWIKAMRREVVDSFPPLRSDWHRFLLMIAAHNGYRIGETPTYYRPRQAGSSKFGWERIPKSFLDVLVLKFLLTFSEAPMRFFGGLGLLGLLAQRPHLPLPGRPLPLHQHPAAPHLHRRRRPGHHQRPALPGRLPRRTDRQPRRAHRPPRTQASA